MHVQSRGNQLPLTLLRGPTKNRSAFEPTILVCPRNPSWYGDIRKDCRTTFSYQTHLTSPSQAIDTSKRGYRKLGARALGTHIQQGSQISKLLLGHRAYGNPQLSTPHRNAHTTHSGPFDYSHPTYSTFPRPTNPH